MILKGIFMSTALVVGALGTITAFAATTPTTPASQTSPDATTHHHKQFGNWGIKTNELTQILGIDTQTLKSDLLAGQTLAQIAQSKGISEQTLISDLESNLKTKLDQAVQNGKLTATNESQVLTKYGSHVQQMVEHKGAPQHGKHHQGQFPGGAFPGLAQALGVNQATLESDLKSGQSIAQIAQTQGISTQTLITTLVNNQKAQLDKAVQSGKLTSAREQKILNNLQNRFTQLVNHQGGFGHGDGQTNTL